MTICYVSEESVSVYRNQLRHNIAVGMTLMGWCICWNRLWALAPV